MNGELHINIWDVQHGNAVYINTPNNKDLVVDLGYGSYGNGQTFSPLKYIYRKYGVKSIEHLFITHPHIDHIDDIQNIDLFRINTLTRAKGISHQRLRQGVSFEDIYKIEKYISIDSSYIYPVSSQKSFDNLENLGGMKVEVFRTTMLSESNINNWSLVIIFTYAESKIVIAGDNEEASWNKLLENNNFIMALRNTDIYLASHHGRESGYHEEIINIMRPKLTIISDSKYHDTSVRERYTKKSQGWLVNKNGNMIERSTLSTYNDGVITIKCGQGNVNPYLAISTSR